MQNQTMYIQHSTRESHYIETPPPRLAVLWAAIEKAAAPTEKWDKKDYGH